MNKITISVISVLSIIVIVLFFLLKGSYTTNANLTKDLNTAKIEITQLKEYNTKKETEIKKIQDTYNKVISNYKGTECENMKVSIEMIEALKTIRDANE